MEEALADESLPRRVRRIVQNTDRLVAAGRLTSGEAERLRAATSAGEAELVVREISRRHASERLNAAVAQGTIGREEAERMLERMCGGEHSMSVSMARHV